MVLNFTGGSFSLCWLQNSLVIHLFALRMVVPTQCRLCCADCHCLIFCNWSLVCSSNPQVSSDKCMHQSVPLQTQAIDLVLYTDTLLDSYGVHLLDHHFSGIWNLSERKLSTDWKWFTVLVINSGI